MIGRERDNARRQLHHHLRGAASHEAISILVDAIEQELLLPLRDEYTYAAVEGFLQVECSRLVQAHPQAATFVDDIRALRERVPRLPQLQDEPPFHRNILRCSDLRVIRDTAGREAVIAKLLEPEVIVEMSKTDMKRQLYTSQDFLDSDKLTRAAAAPRERFKIPCAYSVDEEGDARFVLRDGHHRALMNYANGVGLMVLPSSDITVPAVMSFRTFHKQHGEHALYE